VINDVLILQMSQLKYKHVPLSLSTEKEAAMNAVFDIERAINFTTPTDGPSLMSFSLAYIPWQANKVIAKQIFNSI
jgi:hypothetical protein